jgi:hypothetical protein
MSRIRAGLANGPRAEIENDISYPCLLAVVALKPTLPHVVRRYLRKLAILTRKQLRVSQCISGKTGGLKTLQEAGTSLLVGASSQLKDYAGKRKSLDLACFTITLVSTKSHTAPTLLSAGK